MLKVVISVGGWAVLQKTCDLALKSAQHYLQIMLHKKLLESKTYLSKVVRICPDYFLLEGFPDISTTG